MMRYVVHIKQNKGYLIISITFIFVFRFTICNKINALTSKINKSLCLHSMNKKILAMLNLQEKQHFVIMYEILQIRN